MLILVSLLLAPTHQKNQSYMTCSHMHLLSYRYVNLGQRNCLTEVAHHKCSILLALRGMMVHLSLLQHLLDQLHPLLLQPTVVNPNSTVPSMKLLTYFSISCSLKAHSSLSCSSIILRLVSILSRSSRGGRVGLPCSFSTCPFYHLNLRQASWKTSA